MKTLVNEITGRKDYPVFNQMSNEQIVDYLSVRDWINYDKIELEGDIVETDDCTFKIVNVEIVDFRDI